MPPPNLKNPNRPVNRDQFNRRLSKIHGYCAEKSPMFRIPVMVEFECRLLLSAYYGGENRMACHILRQNFHRLRHEINWMFVLWITDTVGWTRMHHVPANDEYREYWHRHGRQCSGSPNCNNPECIDQSIPKWFRWVSQWDRI